MAPSSSQNKDIFLESLVKHKNFQKVKLYSPLNSWKTSVPSKFLLNVHRDTQIMKMSGYKSTDDHKIRKIWASLQLLFYLEGSLTPFTWASSCLLELNFSYIGTREAKSM